MDPTTAISASVAATQNQVGVAVLRQAFQSQQQLIAILAQSAVPVAAGSNPPHLGHQIDTYA